MRLRSHLLLMTVATAAPVIVLAVVVVALLVQREREAIEDAAVDRTAAVMTAIDADLRGTLTSLFALAGSAHLERGDLRAFHADLVRFLKSQPDWLNANLALPSGERVVDAASPFGRGLPPIGERRSFDLVLSNAEPAISDVGQADLDKVPSVSIRVPVMRNGKVAYVLSAVLNLDSLTTVLRAQRLPEGWVVALVDRNRRFIARLPPQPVGQEISPSFRAAIERAPRGWFRGQTVEGYKTYTPYVTSAVSGWVLGIAMPRAAVDAAAWRTLWLLIGMVLFASALAVGLALLVGRRIERPIVELASATAAVGRGEPAKVPGRTKMPEIDSLAQALEQAAAATSERQALIEREKTALQAADRAKDEFLAMLSHELRNPLAALTAAAHVLKLAEPHQPAAIKARGVVERQTRHMARLVGDLLDISRVAMGKVALERERFNLQEALGNLLNVWRASGRLERHKLLVDASPVWIDADRARIDQIISNLLDNAIKFTPAGRRISIGLRKDGEWALLRVSDEGEGLAPGSAARMFDLFVQGERGLDRAAGGLGIGLALVKRLAELHGGRVEAASAGAGKGATFTVRLPAVMPPAQAAAPEKALQLATPRRVLIVEDNDDMRQMLHESLAFGGHQVREARDGASGIALAAESNPDVALIDIGLPDLDGYEVARRLRAAPGGRRMGLIAITGYGQVEDQRRAYEAGFDAHLTKPVAPERLREVLAGIK